METIRFMTVLLNKCYSTIISHNHRAVKNDMLRKVMLFYDKGEHGCCGGHVWGRLCIYHLPLYSSVNSSSVVVSMSVERGLSLRRDEYGCTEVPYSTRDHSFSLPEETEEGRIRFVHLIWGAPLFIKSGLYLSGNIWRSHDMKNH